MTDEQDPRDYIDWDEGRDFPPTCEACGNIMGLCTCEPDQGEDEEDAVEKQPAVAQDRDPKVGDRIEVNGGTRAFTGIVLGAHEALLIVAEAPGRLVYLRRNIASTDPLTWRCAGRSAQVKIVTRAITRAQQQSFSTKLQELERRTRHFGKL